MQLLVQLVVGELELVEVDDHVGPVGAQSRRVGMDVEPGRRALFFKTLHPRGVLVLVAVLIHWHHVHEENVVCVWVQIKELDLDGRKHPPVGV